MILDTHLILGCALKVLQKHENLMDEFNEEVERFSKEFRQTESCCYCGGTVVVEHDRKYCEDCGWNTQRSLIDGID
ncbi:MAG: hypothetical protein WBA52_20105 [Dolichospermum sp.]